MVCKDRHNNVDKGNILRLFAEINRRDGATVRQWLRCQCCG